MKNKKIKTYIFFILIICYQYYLCGLLFAQDWNENGYIVSYNLTHKQSFHNVNNKTKDIEGGNGVRLWNKSHPLVFIHIGKSGGSSFDKSISPIVKTLGGKYIGNKHFDWSATDLYINPDIVTLLRHPVDRAISHYFFAKTLSWTDSLLIRRLSLSEYLHNPQAMLDTRDIWQDGQAAVSWLTGTHIANWVNILPKQVPGREKRSLNTTDMCLLAAKRLEETLWFGLLDNPTDSLKLLSYQLGFNKQIKWHHFNANKRKSTVITNKDKEILTSLMPQDMWLYDYAKKLFSARWNHYKNGSYIKPDLPTIPEPSCISTRYVIKCNTGPLSPLYFRGTAPVNHTYII